MSSTKPIPAASLVQETAWVHRLARQLVRDPHLAADVAQDTLVAGLHREGPDDPAVTPRGWLAGIARRLALQALRRRREREVRELLAARTGAGDPERRAAERLHVHETLARAVRALREPYRTAVTLRFFEGRSAAAIARQRGHTPDAVRQHVHRGLGMLRRQLDAELGDRRAWIVLFGELGLVRPGQPLPVPFVALAVALLAVAVVVVAAWSSRAAGEPPTPAPAPAPAPAPPDPASWSSTPLPSQDPANVAAAADAYLEPLVRMGAFSGAVLLARGGGVFTKAYGLADHGARIANTTATRFKLMSTTKAVTAVAVMRLVQAGKLRLDDRVGAHVQRWPAEWQDVTVHDLLDHRSGIPNLENEWAQLGRDSGARGLALWPAMAARLAEQPHPREPAASRYSNFNFELAGVVAEAAAGKPWRELLAEQVLVPAGMQATGIDGAARPPALAVGYFLGADAPEPSQQDMSVIQAAGGLWSTVGDLFAFDRALRGGVLLNEATIAMMTAPRERSPGYACGWQVSPVHGRRCQSHSGGANGYVANLLRFPDDDACVVVLSNYAFAPVTRIANDLAAVLLGREHRVSVTLTTAQLDASTGTFGSATNRDRRLLVRRVGSLLVAFELWPGQSRVPGHLLLPLADGRFVAPHGDGQYVFDADGVRTPADELPRVDAGVDAWRGRLGALRMQGGRAGSAELGEVGGRFELRLPDQPAPVEVVPLGADVALAMVMTELGTLLRARGAELQWYRPGSDVVVLTPAK